MKLDRKGYEKELLRLQTELVFMQEWIVAHGRRLVVLFEGRDTAGKDGVIKRITAYLNPRTCRVAALPTPTEREKTRWYFARYAAERAPVPDVEQAHISAVLGDIHAPASTKDALGLIDPKTLTRWPNARDQLHAAIDARP